VSRAAVRPARRAPGLAPVVVGAAWGLTLLGVGRRLDSLLEGASPSSLEIGLTRVLGVRQLGEAAVLWRFGPRARAGVLATEGLHGASMLALAAVSPRHRRIALASLGMAAVLGVLTERSLPHG
jgi:hypothetical protein